MATVRAPELNEKQFERQLLDLLAQTGWNHRYHTYRSMKSPTGFPDEVWVRERVIFAELKRQTGKPTDTQKTWLRALHHAGAEVYLLRPADLDAITTVLACRQAYGDFTGPRAEHARRAASDLRGQLCRELAA